MDLLERTKELCKLYHIIPSRSRGQNFLIKEKIYDDIAAAAELMAGDAVLEVGPGLGFLTAKLAKMVRRVVAVELDDRLAEILRSGLVASEVKNVEVVNDDILKIFKFQIPISKQISNPNFQTKNTESALRVMSYELRDYKIVANLPYNITSIFLRKFLSEVEIRPKLMVLMLQKEVAERIAAIAGKMSLLAVSAQFYARPEILKIVEKENFWPKPEVDSAIIKLEVRPVCRTGKSKELEVNEKDFFRLVKFGFSAKRKMLKNNLAAGLRISQKEAKNKLIKAGFNEKVRAQELSVSDWLKLFGEFNKNMV